MLKTGKNKASRSFFKGLGVFILVWIGHNFLSSRGVGVINKGVSFGWKISNFLVVFFLVAWGVFIFLRGYRKWFFWGLLIGGGVNFLDRLRYGGVRDYFNFFGLFYNNLADWIIFVSVVGAVFFYLKRGIENEREEEKRNKQGF